MLWTALSGYFILAKKSVELIKNYQAVIKVVENELLEGYLLTKHLTTYAGFTRHKFEAGTPNSFCGGIAMGAGLAD